MPFVITNEEHSVVKLTVNTTIPLTDLKAMLGVIEELLKVGSPFAFYVHFNLSSTPLSAPSLIRYLVSWMVKNEKGIKDTLICSAIIVKSVIVKNMFKGIFNIRPTIKPNLITTDPVKGQKFVCDISKKFHEIE